MVPRDTGRARGRSRWLYAQAGQPEPSSQQAVPQPRALKAGGGPSFAGQPEPRDPDLEVGFRFALKLVPIVPIAIKE